MGLLEEANFAHDPLMSIIARLCTGDPVWQRAKDRSGIGSRVRASSIGIKP